jgi:hypothetical protein
MTKNTASWSASQPGKKEKKSNFNKTEYFSAKILKPLNHHFRITEINGEVMQGILKGKVSLYR